MIAIDYLLRRADVDSTRFEAIGVSLGAPFICVAGALDQRGGLNWQFHSTLYAPADRPITLGLMQRLHDHADRYARVQLAVTHWESRASRSIGPTRPPRAARTRGAPVPCCASTSLSAGQSLVTFLREQRDAESSAVVSQA